MAEPGFDGAWVTGLPDRYQLLQQLDEREGRDTWLALARLTQEQVVIKRLFQQNSFSIKEIELFQREAGTLKTLSHPCIPRYLDSFEFHGQDGNGFALVQTYIAGRSLQQWLNEGYRFSESEIYQIAASLLDILIYLHDREPPIIHRDINPGNILITAQPDHSIGQVYLVDFSAVQNFVIESIGSFTVVGTYGYTAPEQLSGRPVKASDLYSLGMTLVQAMTGVDPAKLPHRGRRIEFESLISGSVTLCHWLRQMVEPNLDQRFPSAQSALQALNGEQDTQPITPQKPANSRIVLTKKQHVLEVVLPATIGKLRLHINDRQLILTNELMGWRYNQLPPIRRSDLRKLKFTSQQLIIWVITRKLEFATNQLTKAEINWLVYELAQWLQIPVSAG